MRITYKKFPGTSIKFQEISSISSSSRSCRVDTLTGACYCVLSKCCLLLRTVRNDSSADVVSWCRRHCLLCGNFLPLSDAIRDITSVPDNLLSFLRWWPGKARNCDDRHQVPCSASGLRLIVSDAGQCSSTMPSQTSIAGLSYCAAGCHLDVSRATNCMLVSLYASKADLQIASSCYTTVLSARWLHCKPGTFLSRMS